MAKGFKVGEAPWEVGPNAEAKVDLPQVQQTAQSFAVGEAPWETKAAEAPEHPELVQTMKDMGMDPTVKAGLTLEPLAKALDWGSGVARTAAGGLMGVATGNDVIQDGDVVKAIRGEAVPGNELLKRANVPEGPHANLFPEMRIPFTNTILGKGDTSARDAAGFALETGLDPLTYMTFGGSAAAKGLSPVARATEKAGEKLYKSGLKRVDIEAAKYGKEPVSDILMKEGAWGSASTLQKKMDELGADRLSRRDAILAEATRQGGEVSMNKAMAPLRSEIEKIKAAKDPELQKLAKAFDAKAKQYVKLDKVPEQKILRELPVAQTQLPLDQGSRLKTELELQTPMSGYDATGRKLEGQFGGADYGPGSSGQVTSFVNPPPTGVSANELSAVINNPTDSVLPLYRGGEYVSKRPAPYEVAQDVTPELNVLNPELNVLGVDPKQASGFKTTAGANLPQSAWQDYKINTAAQKLTKAMQSGLRKETEHSVAQAMGHGAEKDLVSLNDELGRILTTREKQAMDAAIEKKKNLFTSIDGGLAGNMLRDPVSGAALFAGKKTGDLLKTSAVRTGIGKGLNRLGAGGRTGPIMDILARRAFVSPWQTMETKKKNGR